MARSTTGEVETNERIQPVYFLNKEVDQEDEKYLSTYEICMVVLEVVADKTVIDAAQKIGGLWRLFLKDRRARAL